jgi:hypothetical protein
MSQTSFPYLLRKLGENSFPEGYGLQSLREHDSLQIESRRDG